MVRASAWVIGLGLWGATVGCTETLRYNHTDEPADADSDKPNDTDEPTPIEPRPDEVELPDAGVWVPPPPTGEDVYKTIQSLRLEPQNAVLTISQQAGASQRFSLFATMEGVDKEVDVTENAVFYVSTNYQLGSFPDDGAVFESNTNKARGGYAIVTARVSNVDGEVLEARAGITLKLQATLTDPRMGGALSADLPADPEALFEADEDNAKKPQLVYPNDGVLLPPNMNQLDVHFRPGAESSIYEVSFDSAVADLRYFIRCGPQENGGCVFALDGLAYRLLADSNRGAPPVKVQVRASNDQGEWVASSDPISIQFTDTDVNGGLYYWTTSGDTAIMRFDFGVENSVPEVFLAPNRDGMGERCIGCHTISPDGHKVVASLGGQREGYQVFVDDLTQARDAPNFIDRNGQARADQQDDRIQFAAFNPDGSRFVSVYGDTIEPDRNTLWFHDGDTGARIPGAELELDFEPDHPAWSADGRLIAMTRVGEHGTSQRPFNGGISLIELLDDDSWSTPLDVLPVVTGDGKSRYNPGFVPDASLIIFSESSCPGGNELSDFCDGDTDPSAKTWAVPPSENAEPVFLARAGAPGIEDQGITDLSDTFPRTSPFEGLYRDPALTLDSDEPLRKVYWVTIASRRRVGLRNQESNQQLWMFAIDPQHVLDGKDGSFPAFHLPFQDPNTRNHIGQWTEEIVDDTPEPVVPEPPPHEIPDPPELG